MLLIGSSGNNPKHDFEHFLKEYGWILCIAIAVAILVAIIAIFIATKKKKNQKKYIGGPIIEKWIKALGTRKNIIDLSATGSRLVIRVKEKENINRDLLNELGVKSIVEMSDKITLVTEHDNQVIVENIQKSLEN